MTESEPRSGAGEGTGNLLDTHLLLWVVADSSRLPESIRSLVDEVSNHLWFSAASIWEVAIRSSLRRPDFAVDPWLLHGALTAHGYLELAITARHTLDVAGLPLLHRDPFDRVLFGQARTEPLILLTNDPRVAEYDGPIQLLA